MPNINTCGSIKWPTQQFGIKPVSGSTNYAFTCAHVVSGVQAVGMNANFDLEPIFQLTQSEIYELNEGLPRIEVTVNRVLDGSCPTYLMASLDATSPTLFGRSPSFTILGMSIFPCTSDSATGSPTAIVGISGAQIGSVGYNFTVDGPATEDVTFLSNNMIWSDPSGANGHPGYIGKSLNPSFVADAATLAFAGCNPTNDDVPRATTGVAFREDMLFTATGVRTADLNGQLADPDVTILPPDIYGINHSGENTSDIALQSISVNVDLNREEIFVLGRRGPRNRTVTLPIQVNTNVDVISEVDHYVSAIEDGIFLPEGSGQCIRARNLTNRTIRIAMCEGLRVYTGVRNKLVSVSRTGGDTGGGNLAVTYSFQTFNTFVVMHINDLHISGAGWWANRSAYLTNT